MATKSSFTSGISTPAWFRMNATANSGSMPGAAAGDDRDGAGRRHGGDVAVPEPAHRADALARRAAGAGLVGTPDAPLPLREDAALRPAARDSTLASSSTNCWILRPSSTPSSESYGMPEPDEQVGQPHDAEADPADPLRQVGDLRERVAVGVDHVLEEVGREVDHLAQARPSRSRRPSTKAPRLIEPRLQTSYGRSGCSPQGLVAS